jgi:RNA polymerase sigma-70 factor (ECF subfamily)
VEQDGIEERERDERLVEAARSGEPRAFERLLERHESRVLRVLRLLGIPRDDREDVAQEVFIRVFRHLHGFRAGQPFSGWLYRITVNASHDHRRLLRRRREAPQREGAVAERADEGPGPAERLDRGDRRRRLERAMESLSERERAVFVLCELEELPTRQVARALAISSITVRRHLGRARRRLQETLRGPDLDKKIAAAVERSGAAGSSS